MSSDASFVDLGNTSSVSSVDLYRIIMNYITLYNIHAGNQLASQRGEAGLKTRDLKSSCSASSVLVSHFPRLLSSRHSNHIYCVIALLSKRSTPSTQRNVPTISTRWSRSRKPSPISSFMEACTLISLHFDSDTRPALLHFE